MQRTQVGLAIAVFALSSFWSGLHLLVEDDAAHVPSRQAAFVTGEHVGDCAACRLATLPTEELPVPISVLESIAFDVRATPEAAVSIPLSVSSPPSRAPPVSC